MRLEVIIDDDQPLFFQFNKKLVVGSDQSCDIIIEHAEVSKKHVIVYPEEDRFYIVDQGSRNGTYLNDERLIPGKKVEFTSFFPVRLGTSVLISLISAEEMTETSKIDIQLPESPRPSKPRTQDSTTVISLKELRSTKTSSLVKKKETSRITQSNKESPKDKKNQKKKKLISGPQIIAFLILSGAAGIHFSMKENKPEQTEAPTVAAPVLKKKETPEVKQIEIAPTSGDTLLAMLPTKGCQTEVEKNICAGITDLRFLQITDTRIDILIDHSNLLSEARLILEDFNKNTGRTTEYSLDSRELAEVATAIFFNRYLSKFPVSELPKRVLTFGLVTKFGEIETLNSISAFETDLFPSLAVLLNHNRIEAIKKVGPEVLNFTSGYYRVWEKDKIIWKGEGPAPVPAPVPAPEPAPEPAPIDNSPENSGTPTSPTPVPGANVP